ncbi:amidase family protein [Streptomyces sp. NPDC002754]
MTEQPVVVAPDTLEDQGRPPADDVHWWSAQRVAAAIAARRLSATEYLDLLLDRVERYDPALNLVVTVSEAAREEARRADRKTASGEPLGPLHGVAMTVKDSLATAGLRTTAGSASLAAYRPAADAEAVARLRAAGAIILGKTNVPEYCADLQTTSAVAGTARNPWQPQYSTGGSSGGAAGAVAAGLTPLELGSDIAGSIRIPASHCGIYGHKPSYGIVSTVGHLPPFQPVDPDLCVVGPLARTVDDLEIALTAVAGPRREHRAAWRLELPPARPIRRVAVWADDPYCPVDRGVAQSVEHAADLLAADGVSVTRDAPRPASASTSATRWAADYSRRWVSPSILATWWPRWHGAS